MDIYLKKRRWKILLLLVAIFIGIASLMYTKWLSGEMAREERKKVELWADATQRLGMVTDEVNSSGSGNIFTLYYTLINKIQSQNTTIPVILTDANDVPIIDDNISYSKNRRDVVLKKELAKMRKYAKPIEIDLGDGHKQHLYYRESYLLRNLRFFPIAQLIVISLFIGIAYFAFNASREAEQNQVWVGMSKETAHQLGTPISSLMAWIELLKMKDVDQSLIKEFESDTQRLEKITERFSKIGSAPELLETNVIEVLNSTIDYLKARSSGKIKFETTFDESAVYMAPINVSLFSWVIENLSKNAIDAMDNSGKISISAYDKGDSLVIDLTDSGKGIPKSQHKTIFRPGFSTKKRGWGLGLSLAKRIVENYHKGKIFIKNSELKKGTTFRIILKKK
ncbi:Two-component system sensor histidine kinase [hydrothermal vent metagenome]|uniref:Two-component system sensor histidine kinase n=1 Tax=hydrothermal vent metagenome TaxID=652676 RepID=A0A3B0T9U0_9ZZZZ